MFDVDPERQRLDGITERIIGASIAVHKELGPGLLESAYEECLCFELSEMGLGFTRQTPLSVRYKSVALDCSYRMDVVVEKSVIVEIKAVERLIPVHEAQLLSYLKLVDLRVGLLINFHVPVLKSGVKRIVNNF